MFQPGDIILKRRKEYKGPFKYLITRMILFFTTEWWTGEKTSKHYHAEMVYAPDTLIISQDFPKVRIKRMGKLDRKDIYRLVNKPENFEYHFYRYCSRKLGQKYDLLRFVSFFFVWMFLGSRVGRWINKKLGLRHRDICSEFVAAFYEEIGCKASDKNPELTSPDDINDYVSMHKEWMKVYPQ